MLPAADPLSIHACNTSLLPGKQELPSCQGLSHLKSTVPDMGRVHSITHWVQTTNCCRLGDHNHLPTTPVTGYHNSLDTLARPPPPPNYAPNHGSHNLPTNPANHGPHCLVTMTSHCIMKSIYLFMGMSRVNTLCTLGLTQAQCLTPCRS